ncbi:DUF2829 domain-containing protein [Yersinia mollaretii]|uniref:DUF2829 domain-containing protein n=1 Tax=Yersinia mollaretii TaxID=33060 RepID=UPI0005EA68BF|nr:DUF2829 domain-containing protein [Yersinia mollaretii]CNE76810.1 Protein of uncharacterised function (DUF2829) [Yersinia mollaretii]
MNFGQALEAVKTGAKIARSGWNGKGQFVIKAGGYTVDEARPGSDYAKAGIEGKFHISPHLDLKNAQGAMQPGWVPSQGDLFADDWVIADSDEHFQHFLSYSGFYDESPEVIEKLKKAYFDGGYALQWK